MSDLFNIIMLAMVGSVVALVGGVVFLYQKKWSKWLTHYSIPFASGVLITVSLLGLLPESEHAIGESAYLLALIGFLGSYVFEHFACDLHHHGECNKRGVSYGSIPLVIAGDTVHNFIDGVAIAVSYLISPGLGIVTALSTLLHEVPHEIGDFGILLKAGWKKNKILMVNVVSAVLTIVGAVSAYYFSASEVLVGSMLAVSSGMFLYLGASDFLPHADDDMSHTKALMSVVIGVVVMYLVLSVVPHSH